MISQRQLRRLHEVGMRFLAPLTPYQTYIALVEEGLKLSKAEWGSVFIPTKHGFKKVYASLPSLLSVVPRKQGTVYTAFHTRKSVVYTKQQIRQLHLYHPEFKGLKIASAVMVPVSYGNESMGVLCLHATRPHHFTKELVQVLELFSTMAFLSMRKTQLYEQLEKALEQRDLFIAMASHELKTPLTAASLYSDMLNTKLASKALPEMRLSQSIVSELSRLKRLVKELLQIESIKKGKMEYNWEKCSIQQIIKQAVKSIKQVYPFHTIYVKYHLTTGKDIVFGDFDKLLQVITNLLTNAAKYSLPNSMITILLEEKEDSLVVSVIDKGKGIHKKDLPKLFDKFYKGENSLHEGMGLGLYLIKHIVDTHGGTLTVQSALNKGTTVSVQLRKYV